jgi:hypothetical protein
MCVSDWSDGEDPMARRCTAKLAQQLGLLLLAVLCLIIIAHAEARAQWAETYGMSSASSPFGGEPPPYGGNSYGGNYWYGQPPPQRAVAPLRRVVRPPANADPGPARRPPRSPAEGAVQAPPPQPTTAFCVRLCDGRFFPLSAPDAKMAPAKMCSALCPASRTKVFEGASIDEAATPDGAPYAKLGTAFLYRKELVANCTCNGKNAFGLAKIDITADPTLRAGDIVATVKGFAVFNGSGGTRHKAANFTPLRKSPLVPGDLRRTLRSLRVAKY